MPYAIRISDGTGRLLGVWWIANETSVAEVAMIDELTHAQHEEKVYDISVLMDQGHLAKVQRDWDAEPVTPDWLDVLVREARPSLAWLAKRVDGPFVTDIDNAEDFLVWAQLHPDDVAKLPTVDRIFVP